MSADHRDLVLTDLADDEAERIDRIVDLTVARDAYRELARASVAALHHINRDCGRLRAQLARLRDEYRHLRERVMRETAAV